MEMEIRIFAVEVKSPVYDIRVDVDDPDEAVRVYNHLKDTQHFTSGALTCILTGEVFCHFEMVKEGNGIRCDEWRATE